MTSEVGMQRRVERTGCPPTVIVAIVAAAVTTGDATAQEAEWSLAPEPLTTIDIVEGDPSYMFQSIRFARFLPDGRIVAADDGPNVVRIYGPDGTLDAEMGSSGEGPGEFVRIDGLWITPDGEIGVWDSGTGRITIFAVDGTLESSNSVTAASLSAAGRAEMFAGAFADGSIAVASPSRPLRPAGDELVADPWGLHRIHLDGDYGGTLGEIRGMQRTRGQPWAFTSLPYFGIRGESLLVADGPEPAIAVRDGSGETIRTLALPLEPTTVGDEIWAYLEQEMELRGRTLTSRSLEWMARDHDLPAIGGLLVDDSGLIWVKRFDPMTDGLYLKTGYALAAGPGGEWLVARPTGEAVARISMPEGTVPMDVVGDRLLGVNRDELDVERLIVYRLER